MEVSVEGTTFIVNESYDTEDIEKRKETIAEKIARLIIMDNLELCKQVHNE